MVRVCVVVAMCTSVERVVSRIESVSPCGVVGPIARETSLFVDDVYVKYWINLPQRTLFF